MSLAALVALVLVHVVALVLLMARVLVPLVSLGQLAPQPLPRPWVGPAGTANRVSRHTVPRRGAPGLIHSHRGEFGPR